MGESPHERGEEKKAKQNSDQAKRTKKKKDITFCALDITGNL